MRKPSSSDRLVQHPLQDSLLSKQSLKRRSSWDLDNMQVSSQHYAFSGLVRNACTCLDPGLGVCLLPRWVERSHNDPNMFVQSI